MLGFNAFAADTNDEGERLASSMQQTFVNLRSGQPTPLQPPVEGYKQSLPRPQQAMLDQLLSCSAIGAPGTVKAAIRSEEHTSELQSLMRISYAVFCLKQKKLKNTKK